MSSTVTAGMPGSYHDNCTRQVATDLTVGVVRELSIVKPNGSRTTVNVTLGELTS